MSDFPDKIENGIEDAFEDGLPRLGRSARRAAQKLVRKARTRGARSEEIVEPGKVARAIVTEAVAHSHALDTKGEQLTAPNFYYVVVPWLSYEHLYKPHMREVVRNIEESVQERLASDRYRIRIYPHVAIGQGTNLPDDKLKVTSCYTADEWKALAGGDILTPQPRAQEREGDVPRETHVPHTPTSTPAPERGPSQTVRDGQDGTYDHTILDGDQAAVRRGDNPGDSSVARDAYLTIPGISGRYAVSDGATIGRAHSASGGEGADITVPKGMDDERLPYVSHVNGVFRLRDQRGERRWSYQQLGPNTTVVTTVRGKETECHEGESIWLSEGDRLYLSRMSVPVVFHDGATHGQPTVAPTQFMPHGR